MSTVTGVIRKLILPIYIFQLIRFMNEHIYCFGKMDNEQVVVTMFCFSEFYIFFSSSKKEMSCQAGHRGAL